MKSWSLNLVKPLNLKNIRALSLVNQAISQSVSKTVSALSVDSNRVKEKYKSRAPNQPVVLCHGLFGNDSHYWGNVPQVLEEYGVKVKVAQVSPVGDIKERSRQLHQFISSNFPDQDVNLVAHSMGGLDARYLITHMDHQNFTIRSLTTIATPHRGSTFMDWVREYSGLGNEDKKNISKILAPLDKPGFSNLTTDYMTQNFNPSTPNDPNVQYYSYGASVLSTPSLLLKIPFRIVSSQEGENDGVVSVYSSKWGQYLGTVPVDHFSLHGHNNGRFQSFINQAVTSISSSSGSSKQSLNQNYQTKVETVLNNLHPALFDDYVYGQEYLHSVDNWTNYGTNLDGSFDVAKFYLDVMTKLSDEGF